MTTEFEILDTLLPENLKTATITGNSDKIASVITGMTAFSFKDVANYVGTKIAERHNKNRSVVLGLLALRELKG